MFTYDLFRSLLRPSHISFSIVCVILCNWVLENFHRFRIVIFRILVRSMCRDVSFKQFCFARPTDSDESTALLSLDYIFLLVKEVIYVLFHCLHWILCFNFLVVIRRAYEVQIVQHLDDDHLVACPIDPCESSHLVKPDIFSSFTTTILNSGFRPCKIQVHCLKKF